MEKVEEKEVEGNWFDSEFPEALNLLLESLSGFFGQEIYQDSDGDYYYEEEIEDEDEDVKRIYFNLIWNKVYAARCPSCNDKYIICIDKNTDEFYRYDIEYCLPCGYPQGVIEYEKLEDYGEIKDAINRGYSVNEKEIEIIEKMYPLSFDKELILNTIKDDDISDLPEGLRKAIITRRDKPQDFNDAMYQNMYHNLLRKNPEDFDRIETKYRQKAKIARIIRKLGLDHLKVNK